MQFQKALAKFKADHIRELSLSEPGMKFLKLRSLSRKSQLEYLMEKTGLGFGNLRSSQWLQALYESELTVAIIDEVIQELYELERQERRKTEDELINELYKVQSFEWGGLYQNSLERTIVDNYVKKIKSYSLLTTAIENDLQNSLRAYVLASWYNHWTSLIIEDILAQ